MRNVGLVCVTLTSLNLLFSSQVEACKCPHNSVTDRAAGSALIFIGAAKFFTPASNNESIVSFSIVRILKGLRKHETIELFYDPDRECGTGIAMGKTYLVFANTNPRRDLLELNRCATKSLGEAKKDIFYLDTPKDEATCLKKHGKWARVHTLEPECDVPTSDAGHECQDSSECERACVAHLTQEQEKSLIPYGAHSLNLKGRCSTGAVFGCQPFVENGIVKGLRCVD